MKTLRYAIEAFFVFVLLNILRLMPPSTASNVGGWIGRTIGPKLAASRKAIQNIRRALPECTETEIARINAGMWENLGRVIAEYSHLETIARDYTTIEGLEHLQSYLADKQPVIYIGGHFANWEINGTAPLLQKGIALDLTYREPNNPWSAKLLSKARTLNGKITTYPKSRESGRAILQAIKNGRSLGILIDQKYNEGVEALFFRQPAMTNPVFVQFAQKYKCPLIPARVVREGSCRFRLTIYPPIPVFDGDGSARPIGEIIADTHALLEGWIREKPEQWMWLHRRWKS